MVCRNRTKLQRSLNVVQNYVISYSGRRYCFSLYLRNREHLYNLTAGDGAPLIHACYPTGNPQKIFVLCNVSNKKDVLNVIQTIPTMIDNTFEPTAKTTYLCATGYPQGPFVKNHPIPNAKNTTYANKLVDITTIPGAVATDHTRPDGQ